MKATMSETLWSAAFSLMATQNFVHHLTTLYHTTVFWSILYDGRTCGDAGGSSWLLPWSDVEMIPESTTSKSKKRGLTKTRHVPTQTEGLTKSSHVHCEGLTRFPQSHYTCCLLCSSADLLTIVPDSKVSAPVSGPKSLRTRIHILSRQLLGALPEPLHSLYSLIDTTSHPVIGPYQTPSSATKTDQLKKKNRNKNGPTFLTGVAVPQPQPVRNFVFFVKLRIEIMFLTLSCLSPNMSNWSKTCRVCPLCWDECKS